MDTRITSRRGALSLVLVAVLVCAVSAQTTLGRLSGTVLDSSGAVLPGATVTLTSEQTNQVQTAVSGETGAFLFPQVLVGTYKVEITAQGFRSTTFTKVSIAVGQEYALTARLELGNVSENVTVEAGASLVPTTSPEVATTVLQKQIVSLPLNGRNPISLVQLQAGVASLGRTSTAINGGRPTWTQVTQDGVNIQDNFIRTNSVDFVPNRPTSDNVGEFSIVTTAQGADNAGGASQVRMITPSGSNAFKGNAYEYNRNSRFATNTFFNKRSNLPISYLNRNQFGGSIGGPIIRDTLFFYSNYEAFRQQSLHPGTLPLPSVGSPSRDIEMRLEPMPLRQASYRLTVTNRSARPLIAFGYVAYRGSDRVLGGVRRGAEHTPVIDPGQSYELELTRRPPVPASKPDSAWPPDRVEISALLWSDGRVEGDSALGAEERAIDAGTALQLARMLEVLRVAADAPTAHPLRTLRAELDGLSVNITPEEASAARAARQDLQSRSLADVRMAMIEGMQKARTAVVYECDERLRVPTPLIETTYRQWAADMVRRLEAWRGRATAPH